MTLIADIGSAVDDAILSILENPDLTRIYDRVVQARQRALAWPDECVDGEVVGYEPPPPPSTTFPEGVYRAPRPNQRAAARERRGGNDQAFNNESEHWAVPFRRVDASFTQVLADGSEPQGCNAAYTVDGDGLLTMEPACGTEGTYSSHRPPRASPWR